MTQHQHHDIVEEPGTYRSNFACVLGLLFSVCTIAFGFWLSSMAPGLAWSTVAVGVATLLIFAGRLWAGVPGPASWVVIVLGVYSWYSPHAFGLDPNVFEESRLGMCWAEVGVGMWMVFLGAWTALGAPGKVEHESFFYQTER